MDLTRLNILRFYYDYFEFIRVDGLSAGGSCQISHYFE